MSDDAQPLFAPTNPPTIELRDSEGVVQVNFSAMTAGTTGIYTFTHQTATSDAYGIWQVRFKVTDGSDIDISVPQDAFELVP